MAQKKNKIGIIICDRYKSCAGGKCFRALEERVGAFARYMNEDVEVAGYTSCGGCPGGNVEYTVDEMQKNGVTAIHLATGLLVGYPPCPRSAYFKRYIEKKYSIPVVFGTHPIPQKYLDTHDSLKTWTGPEWQDRLADVMDDENTRLAYN